MSIDIEIKSRAIGCLMGQAIGDALGTRYEFSKSKTVIQQINDDLVNGHLPILGEGPLDVKPGQVTDDTELALGLTHSLIRNHNFDIKDIAHTYCRWFRSDPFDIGLTTSNALIDTSIKYSKNQNYSVMINSSIKSNSNSLSNGCLMRISPLAIAGARWQPKNLRTAAKLDCQLTNPNPIMLDAVSVYVTALQIAILTGDKCKVYDGAVKIAKTTTVKKLLTQALKSAEPTILDDGKAVATQGPNMGYFGIAIQNTFYELMNGDNFEKSLINIIKRGGDTDTNGCIAGALLGAIYGVLTIPHDWIRTVVSANVSERYLAYPDVKTHDLPELALELLTSIDEPQFNNI